jgi:hypothetical protein
MLTLIVATVAVIIGLAVGWTLRGTTSWCAVCGNLMACTECPRPVAGRRPHNHPAQRSHA